MTEDEARAYVETIGGAKGVDRVDTFLRLVAEENERQNLIARASVGQIWARHAADSAQLIPLGEGRPGLWIDIGTGGGFPGMIVAILRDQPILLVEPRRKRAEFLAHASEVVGIASRVSVKASKIEKVQGEATIISARAVASVEKLLLAATACATISTRWILPRGRFDAEEMQRLQREWAMMFHVEHSVTDAESSIVVLDRVARR